MSLVVQKFGGSSVANAERIMAAARRALRARQSGKQVIMVVSARGDTTDELIELAHQITDKPPAREMDMLLSTGEQISIALMAMAIQSLGQPAISFTGAQIGIVTDSFHTKARIKNISTERIRHALDEGKVVIVAGFQGVDENYNITTLGRGGSDTTAVALAAVMKHDKAGSQGAGLGNEVVDCELYTDVDGIYTTDPRIVPEARKIDFISYDEVLELASLGANVLHSRSIEFAKKFGVPLQKRSSFSDAEGTWIVPEAEWMRDIVVCGAAMVKDEARVLLDGVPDQPGVSHRVFSAIAEQNIVVDMIAQNVGSGGKAAIGFTVLKNELPATLAVLQPLARELAATVHHEEDLSKVSVVGTGMRTHSGVAERMFAALAADTINMKMITTGDIKISVLVNKTDGVKALRAVHQAFDLDKPRPGAGRPAGPAPQGPFQRRPAAVMEELGKDYAVTSQQLSSMEDIVVSDVILDSEHGRITIVDLQDKPGNCSSVFQAVAAGSIVVDMIVQNLAAAGRAELSFSVPRGDLARAQKLVQEAVKVLDPAARVLADENIAKVFVVGVGMRTHTGVARRMFGALAGRGINISMINTSEVCVSVVVDRQRGEEALACLQQAFGIK
ncbi:aspartate kinase [Planctomycetaceae bacterium SCGC AG-212-F19]|nr:aspartate kinase [Planctomycetaceae bacterium SCGC AG-212-F19]